MLTANAANSRLKTLEIALKPPRPMTRMNKPEATNVSQAIKTFKAKAINTT